MTAPKIRKKGASVKRREPARPLPVSIHPVRDGEWSPRDEFYAQVLGLATAGVDIVVDLYGVDYLDASSLQMLLALSVAQTSQSRGLLLSHASPGLLCWFEYAGAAKQFTFA